MVFLSLYVAPAHASLFTNTLTCVKSNWGCKGSAGRTAPVRSGSPPVVCVLERRAHGDTQRQGNPPRRAPQGDRCGWMRRSWEEELYNSLLALPSPIWTPSEPNRPEEIEKGVINELVHPITSFIKHLLVWTITQQSRWYIFYTTGSFTL